MQIFKPVVEVTQPEVLAGLKAALAKEATELKAEHGHDHAGHADGKHGRSEFVDSKASDAAIHVYSRAGGVPTRHAHRWNGLHTRHLLERPCIVMRQCGPSGLRPYVPC